MERTVCCSPCSVHVQGACVGRESSDTKGGIGYLYINSFEGHKVYYPGASNALCVPACLPAC